ncbi:hypothetical protein ABEV34_04900 [Methylorubrum rhodesianum]|uniref:hypothetical protein n=1 Tax=Methylorubrum TaxID=2282523 RepID=UPI001E598610|nr:hypothetical protein [Methylorubrum sp. B1-46]UGB28672.1 hypothetical protein LPC10_25475 [Methylorubrum sp. B1-46]
MTGIVALLQPNEVALFTDGAYLDYAGKMVHVASKVLLMPEWPGAIACRGPSQFIWTIRTHWDGAVGSLDDALERVLDDAQLFQKVFEMHRHQKSEWELVLVGWSHERQAFEVWDVHGGPVSPYTDHPPLTLRKMMSPVGAWPTPDQKRLDALQADLGAGERPHPHQVAAMLMQAMRESELPDPRNPAVKQHNIGGFIQRAVIDHQACSTDIIHRWPDEKGKSINPFPPEQAP